LLRRAIEATGLTDRAFAKTRLLVQERTLRNYKSGASKIPGPVRIICRVILDHPAASRELARAASKVKRTG
jgi:DNA-binding transcriptional regulator YiaG